MFVELRGGFSVYPVFHGFVSEDVFSGFIYDVFYPLDGDVVFPSVHDFCRDTREIEPPAVEDRFSYHVMIQDCGVLLEFQAIEFG